MTPVVIAMLVIAMWILWVIAVSILWRLVLKPKRNRKREWRDAMIARSMERIRGKN